MLSEKQRISQRGSVSTEFVLVVPILAFAMLFLMGLGYTLMTKQNSLVGARAAAFYRAPMDQPPPPSTINAVIKNAVSPGREEWSLEHLEGTMDSPTSGQGGLLAGVVAGLYQRVNKEISYTARVTPTLGLLPRVMNVGQAQSTYYLPRGTWTCAQTGGGSYSSVTLGGMGLPPPISGLFDLSCCETY
jgi:hypothetical protein